MNLLLWTAVVLVCLGAGAATGGFLGYITSRAPIAELEHYDPVQVTRVFDGTGNSLVAEFYGEAAKGRMEKRQVLSLAQMPPALPNAFIAIEDERFREHFGVDPRGVARAIVTDLRTGRKAQGASTITMQMARKGIDHSI